MYFDTSILILLPAILFALWAQSRVKSTYAKYSKEFASLTGAEAARMVLEMNGVNDVTIEPVAGELTDHFDPKTNTIRLSKGVYDVTSVAAVGVAAHEAGHAVQYAVGYSPIKLRTAIIPVTQIGSSIAPLLLLAGLLFSYQPLILWVIAAFSLMLVFQLVTLPVEFNASRRAMQTLDGMNMLDDDELRGTRKVLSAAAMTYVAAMLVSLTQVLRLLLMFNRRRD